MVSSNYNYFIQLDKNRFIVFNGFTKKFFVSASEYIENYKELLSDPDKYATNNAYTKIIDKLSSNGFIIEGDLDEYETLRNRYNVMRADKSCTLLIMSTYSCNFSCWYCVQHHNKELITDDIENKIKKHINKYLTENKIKNLYISWFGGEPLLNFKKIESISKYAQEFCKSNGIGFSCGITTNGSLITDQMIEKMKELNFVNFQITIDGSKDCHNKTKNNNKIKNSFHLILNNIKRIVNNIPEVYLTLRINYTKENLSDNLHEELDEVLHPINRKITIMLRKVWQEEETEDLHNRVSILTKRLLCKGYKIEHDFNNMGLLSCYVEKEHYHAIFPNGLVDRCSNKEFEKARGFLSDEGDIIWNETLLDKNINIFDSESECKTCRFLPICMGPCPASRESYINDSCIKCNIQNKEQAFKNDIIDYCQLTTAFQL